MTARKTWVLKKLTDLAQYINGRAFTPEDWGQEGLPIIRIEQLKNPKAPTNYFGGKLPTQQLIDNGDLIFSWSASLFLRIWENGPAALNQHLFKVMEKPNVNRVFLKLLIEFHLPQLTRASHGSTMQHITRRELERFQALIPSSRDEQSKIAQILSTVDRAIEQAEALIAKQQRIKAGLMQDLLTRGIDERGTLRSEKTHQFKDSPLGRIPVEWGLGGLDSYVVNDAGIKPGPFGSSLTKDMYVQSGYRVFGQEQVIGGSFDIGDYFVSKKKFMQLANFAVRAGDVLISLVGTIGHVLIVPKDHHPGLINPRLLRFRPDHKYCLPEFLRYLILSHPTRHQLDALATGGTMAVISAGIVKKLCIVIVGISEQARNIQMLEKSEICILESFKYLKKLNSLKTALMQDLLTGRKRVTSLLPKEEMANV